MRDHKYPSWLEKSQRRNFRRLAKNFTLVGGRLTKPVAHTHLSGFQVERLVPVAKSAREIVEEAHETHRDVHFGEKATFGEVRKHLFWRGMRKSVKRAVCKCVHCVDHRLKMAKAPWTRIVCTAPLEMVFPL